MKETSDLTAIVFDHGLFLPLALRLAQFYKRVLYHKPGTEAFPTLNSACIGDGFGLIERCPDPWPEIDAGEVDLCVFPDILDSGAQLHIESLGIPVWGSRRGDSLELNREKFMATLGRVGLEVPKFERVIGWTALAKVLRERENVYLKISRYRGSMETCHWRSWALDEGLLDTLAVRFGAAKELVPFLVFDAIDTPLEIGCDTYCVDGKWPTLMLNGFECKDKGYLGAVTPRDDMPQQVQDVLDAFGPVLAPYRYRNQFSMEIRVLDNKAYFTDATCRGGLPSTASQMTLWSNLGDVIWAGAHGELIEPEPAADFSAEVMLTLKSNDKSAWRVTEIPPALEPWMKIPDCCQVDGRIGIPPDDQRGGDEIGWLVAVADSPKAVIQKLLEHVALLPDGVHAQVESLVDLVKEIEIAEDEGIQFTEKPLPTAAEVVA